MRLTKIVTLTAIATMAATAFVGASSASAAEHEEIVLCKNAELICETPYPNPTEIHLETLTGEPPRLLTGVGTVECEHSLAIVTLLNELAELVEGHLLALNFTGNCHLAKIPCEVKVNALGGISVTPDATKLSAIVRSIELEGRNTNVTVKCGSFLNCTYSAGAETLLTAQSDGKGHLLALAQETPLATKGILCPQVDKWDAVYHAINLDEELTLKTGLWIEL